MMWFGTGEDSKIALLAYATVFVVALNTMAGVANIPRNQIRAACCFGATRWQIFLLVTIPATLNYMVTGMRLAMGNCFQTVVAAELVVATAGFGFVIMSGYRNFEADVMAAGIVAIALTGFVMDLLFQLGPEACRHTCVSKIPDVKRRACHVP
jgi:NitT/TauT family transport system permease protein